MTALSTMSAIIISNNPPPLHQVMFKAPPRSTRKTTPNPSIKESPNSPSRQQTMESKCHLNVEQKDDVLMQLEQDGSSEIDEMIYKSGQTISDEEVGDGEEREKGRDERSDVECEMAEVEEKGEGTGGEDGGVGGEGGEGGETKERCKGRGRRTRSKDKKGQGKAVNIPSIEYPVSMQSIME